MGVYEELVERGLIAQTTDEEHIRDLVNNAYRRQATSQLH